MADPTVIINQLQDLDDDDVIPFLLESLTAEDLQDVSPSFAKPIVVYLKNRDFTVKRSKSETYGKALLNFLYPDESDELEAPNHENGDPVVQAGADQGEDDPPAEIAAASDPKDRDLVLRLLSLEERLKRLQKKRKRSPVRDNDSFHHTLLRGLESLRPPNAKRRQQEREQEQQADHDGYLSESSVGSASSRRGDPSPQGNGSAQLSFSRRKLRLNTVKREAEKIHADMVAQSANATNYVTSLSLEKKRNFREALAIARSIDFLVDQFGPAFVKKADACEVMMRRLVAVIQADLSGGDWENATFLEETPDGWRAGSDSLYNSAMKMAESHRRLKTKTHPTRDRPQGQADPVQKGQRQQLHSTRLLTPPP